MADDLVSEGAPTWSALYQSIGEQDILLVLSAVESTPCCLIALSSPSVSLPIACTLCFATLLAYPAWYAWHLDLCHLYPFCLRCHCLVRLVLWAFIPLTYLIGITYCRYSLQAPFLAPQLRHYAVK